MPVFEEGCDMKQNQWFFIAVNCHPSIPPTGHKLGKKNLKLFLLSVTVFSLNL